MHSKINIVFSVCISICVTIVQSNHLSWCDPKICPNGKQHVACGNNGKFHEYCSEDATMIDLKSYRNDILHEHNKRRNFIASGLLPGYYPAEQMATMAWDEELAYLATLNLKTCHLDHDDCNSSHRFRNTGQNLCALARKREPVADVTDILQTSMGLWFGEYTLIDSSYISKFRATTDLEKYGHFAELVLDRNTHVGCAMMRFTNPDYPYIYIFRFACNYASIYALEVPVYRAGKPASECKTGSNPFYPSLCSTKEKYNPNYVEEL